MSLFDRSESKRLARTVIAMLMCGSAFCVTGCASGQRQQFRAFGPTPTPTPVITPSPTQALPQQQPSQSGPVILPRDSFRRPPGRLQVQFGRRPGIRPAAPPTITPRNVPSPLASPVIRHMPPPAQLSGQIEIVPNSHVADSTSQRKHFDIVPKEPAKLNTDAVELLPAPVGGKYEELPPPPE